MEFTLDDEQLALQATARRFAQTEIAPIAAEHDQSGEFPMEVMKKAWELGLASISIPRRTISKSQSLVFCECSASAPWSSAIS